MRSSQYQYGVRRSRLARKPLMSVNGTKKIGTSAVASCGLGAAAPTKRPMDCVVSATRTMVASVMKKWSAPARSPAEKYTMMAKMDGKSSWHCRGVSPTSRPPSQENESGWRRWPLTNLERRLGDGLAEKVRQNLVHSVVILSAEDGLFHGEHERRLKTWGMSTPEGRSPRPVAI